MLFRKHHIEWEVALLTCDDCLTRIAHLKEVSVRGAQRTFQVDELMKDRKGHAMFLNERGRRVALCAAKRRDSSDTLLAQAQS